MMENSFDGKSGVLAPSEFNLQPEQQFSANDLLSQRGMANGSADGPTPAPVFAMKREEDIYKPEIFYGLCYKEKYCWGRIPCGKFKNRTHVIQFAITIVMLLCLFTSVIVPLILYEFAEEGINDQVVIDDEDAPNFDAWQTNSEGDGADDVKIHYLLYLFDVQNPNEILAGEKPRVSQLGPYAFREYYYKFDIDWSDDGDTVTYSTYKYYLFNEQATAAGLSLDDRVTLPYTSAIAFEYLLGNLPHNATVMLDAAVNKKIVGSQQQIDAVIDNLLSKIEDRPLLPDRVKQRIEGMIGGLEDELDGFFNRLLTFAEESTPATLLMKVLLCGTDSGLSPFWEVGPYEAWFGWLQDPLLLEVQKVLDAIEAATGEHTPWTSALPGASTNFSSIEDTRRRRAPDTFKTGKKNVNQVGQYVKYQGMKSLWTCVLPMNSQDPDEYEEGEQYPACAYFDENWSDEEAEAAGYVQPFASDYANRIEGTDANMFGRPVTSDKVQIFISDIYRSAFIEYDDDVKWHGVSLRRYALQEKDLMNHTANPENEDYYSFGPSGMENTTKAVGIPVFVSFPHFLYGEDKLVAAVSGLSPNELDHQSYLDIEPQTGLLARVRKRLQVNYQMKSYELPSTQNDSIAEANMLCSQLAEIVQLMQQFGIDTGNITEINCELTLATELLTCLNQESTWNLRNSEIFFPYAWVDEGMDLPNSDAEDLSDSLYELDSLASAIRMWCLVAAGICFAALLAIQYHSYMDRKYRTKKYGKLTPLLDRLLAEEEEQEQQAQDRDDVFSSSNCSPVHSPAASHQSHTHQHFSEAHHLRQKQLADILRAEKQELEEEEIRSRARSQVTDI